MGRGERQCGDLIELGVNGDGPLGKNTKGKYIKSDKGVYRIFLERRNSSLPWKGSCSRILFWLILFTSSSFIPTCFFTTCLEAAPNSVESEGRFRLSTILSHLSFGVHRNLVSEFGFQHPEVLVALDAPEVLLRLQEG